MKVLHLPPQLSQRSLTSTLLGLLSQPLRHLQVSVLIKLPLYAIFSLYPPSTWSCRRRRPRIRPAVLNWSDNLRCQVEEKRVIEIGESIIKYKSDAKQDTVSFSIPNNSKWWKGVSIQLKTFNRLTVIETPECNTLKNMLAVIKTNDLTPHHSRFTADRYQDPCIGWSSCRFPNCPPLPQ